MCHIDWGPEETPLCPSSWKQPGDTFIEMNFDASFKMDTKFAGTGVIARYGNGRIMGACEIVNKGVSFPFAAEALACVQALSFARDMGFQNVILEGDSRTVINKIQHEGLDRSTISPYVSDEKALMNQVLEVKPKHTHRQCNKIAHLLAGDALHRDQDWCWVEEVPRVAADRRTVEPPD